jgi:hypothetical protein
LPSVSFSGKKLNRSAKSDTLCNAQVQLVMGFGARDMVDRSELYNSLQAQYPSADVVLCSTSGEIFDDKVLDDSVSITAIEFDKTSIITTEVNIDDHDNDSFRQGWHWLKDWRSPRRFAISWFCRTGVK